MASLSELRTRAAQVRDETAKKANTALRVGSLFLDIINFFFDMFAGTKKVVNLEDKTVITKTYTRPNLTGLSSIGSFVGGERIDDAFKGIAGFNLMDSCGVASYMYMSGNTVPYIYGYVANKGIVNPTDYFIHDGNNMNGYGDFPFYGTLNPPSGVFSVYAIESGLKVLVLWRESTTQKFYLTHVDLAKSHMADGNFLNIKHKDITADVSGYSNPQGWQKARLITPDNGKHIYIIGQDNDSHSAYIVCTSYTCSSMAFDVDNLVLVESYVSKLIPDVEESSYANYKGAYLSIDGKSIYLLLSSTYRHATIRRYELLTPYLFSSINSAYLDTYEITDDNYTDWSINESLNKIAFVNSDYRFFLYSFTSVLSSTVEENSNSAVVTLDENGDGEKELLQNLSTTNKTVVGAINEIAEGHYKLKITIPRGTSVIKEAFVDGVIGQRVPNFIGKTVSGSIVVRGTGDYFYEGSLSSKASVYASWDFNMLAAMDSYNFMNENYAADYCTFQWSDWFDDSPANTSNFFVILDAYRNSVRVFARSHTFDIANVDINYEVDIYLKAL